MARWREMSDREIARIRTGIGMVFQRFNLFPHLTALENVMLGPTRVLKYSRAEAEPLARGLLRKVGLAHKADDYPEKLSGGQQQRVAIARSLGDAAEADAVRRGDLGAGSRADRRGAERDARSRRATG